MAEQKPILATEAAPAPDLYKPLSGLAIAAIMVAVLYAALMSVMAILALTSGTPLFLGRWTLLIPLTGAVLAFAARNQIRRSEGIRGGMTLATWARWLCLVYGLGYAAYYVGTRIAVTWQAKEETDKWFRILREGKVNEAFLYTLPPRDRKNYLVEAKRNDPSLGVELYGRFGQSIGRRKGPYVAFQDLEVVRTLQEWGRDAEVTHVGVKNWDYEKGGYVVTQTYRIKTPESENTVEIAIQSAERPDWQVKQERVGFPAPGTLTEFGKTLEHWRQQAREFAGEFLRKKYTSDAIGAFLDTVPPDERPKRQREFSALVISGLVPQFSGGLDHLASQVLRESCARLYWPAYRDFASGKLISEHGFQTPPMREKDPAKKENPLSEMLAEIRAPLNRPTWTGVRLNERNARIRIHDKEHGPVQIIEQLDWAILPPDAPVGAPTKYTVEAALVLESDRGPVTRDRRPQWRVVGLQLLRGAVPVPDSEGRPQ